MSESSQTDRAGGETSREAHEPSLRSDLKGFALVAMTIGVCLLLLQIHLVVHTGSGLMSAIQAPDERLMRFEFVGGQPNGFSIAVDVTIWSLMGIHCRLAYMIGHATLTSGVRFVQTLTLWASTALFGWGTALAVVFLVRPLKIVFGGFELGLSSLESFVTISFVLGFYNEQARRVLSAVCDVLLPFRRGAGAPAGTQSRIA